ncbi:MAG: response regulator transcription factor [Fusobacterium sp.]|nr:response regulator transcription factor [Fusobacterium sp.]
MTKVLLVDDNSKYLKDALPFYGYEVTCADDGVQALKTLAKNFDFDIILLDVMMPNMNGWETLRNIRQNSLTEHLPVIMLTAVNDEQKMVLGLKNGADDYIVKPFMLPNLLARMEAVLRRSKPKSGKVQTSSALSNLTNKEKEVLSMLAKGASNKEIADKMVVKEVTVKTHLNSIYKKLNVTGRTQAILIAMNMNL